MKTYTFKMRTHSLKMNTYSLKTLQIYRVHTDWPNKVILFFCYFCFFVRQAHIFQKKKTRGADKSTSYFNNIYNIHIPPTNENRLKRFDSFQAVRIGRRLPTLPPLGSTIGVDGLNFSVRNGKRWNPGAIATINNIDISYTFSFVI